LTVGRNGLSVGSVVRSDPVSGDVGERLADPQPVAGNPYGHIVGFVRSFQQLP
jgi:hypothetical protein